MEEWNFLLPKRREPPGNFTRRKLSLRKSIPQSTENECVLDITQVTKCIFMGVLHLKPAPQLFESPELLQELNMRFREGDEVKEEQVYTDLVAVPTPEKVEENGVKPPEDPDKGIADDLGVAPAGHTPPEPLIAQNPAYIADEPILDLDTLTSLPPDLESFEALPHTLLKREPTPELMLSDSDDDVIDQLMYNIMDIKVGPFLKDFYDAKPFVEEPQPPAEDAKKTARKPPQCKICSQVFRNYLQLKKHSKAHNGDRPYICVKCGAAHGSLDQLLAHLRIHQGKRPYVCKKCSKSFKTLKALDEHKPLHVLRKITPPKKVFKCTVCGKEFSKLCDLERHTRVHTGEKPSVCNICNRRFQQAHNLNKHLLIHTQEKPFSCDICNKKFSRNDVLNRHLLTHTVKKPNTCEICLKSFIRASQLTAHKDKCHS